MPTSLHISATFLTGRYHGFEWPPSPARLVQALVAASRTGGNRRHWPAVREALLWLERQPPPRIRTRPAADLTGYRTAVPNNDFDVIAREWAAGREANPASIRTLKVVNPRALQNPELLPHVQYTWPLDSGDVSSRAAHGLRPAIQSLYSLGWGVDMAFADLQIAEDQDAPGWIDWIPAGNGIRFPVPIAGFVADLESTYQRFVARISRGGVDTDTRPRVYGLQAYERQGVLQPAFASFELRDLNDEQVFQKPWRDAIELAAWLRHAAGEHLAHQNFGESLEGYIFGHPKDPADANRRLSYLPLPSIHTLHGDGRVRRVMIAEPLGAPGQVTQLLSSVWRGAALKKDGKEVCLLRPFDRDSVTGFYTGLAKRWNTVTPVILHGHNANRGLISVQKTEKLLVRAFEMAGRPESLIESLAFQTAPLWPRTGAATEIRVPPHLDRYPRYHVQVVFKDKVLGPVTAGIGRHFGIGLFAAANTT